MQQEQETETEVHRWKRPWDKNGFAIICIMSQPRFEKFGKKKKNQNKKTMKSIMAQPEKHAEWPNARRKRKAESLSRTDRLTAAWAISKLGHSVGECRFRSLRVASNIYRLLSASQRLSSNWEPRRAAVEDLLLMLLLLLLLLLLLDCFSPGVPRKFVVEVWSGLVLSMGWGVGRARRGEQPDDGTPNSLKMSPHASQPASDISPIQQG
mmetsp:Transcript_75863/g.158159  ORF Transcript_75863/g.158159 Transcript_75863/m.158159 type:complete len:209 (-) Transcript_75863:1385-2011(-)